MKKRIVFLTVLIFTLMLTAAKTSIALAQEGTYFGNMKRDFVRGLTNVISSPLEIPITMQEYHERAGRPLIRHTAGFFDGAVQTVERAGSGLWDLLAMWVPGDQEGLPPTPETLF